MVGGSSDGIARSAGMSVRRIGSDGDVDSDRRRMAVGLAEQAGGAIARIGDFVEMQAERLAESRYRL